MASRSVTPEPGGLTRTTSPAEGLVAEGAVAVDISPPAETGATAGGGDREPLLAPGALSSDAVAAAAQRRSPPLAISPERPPRRTAPTQVERRRSSSAASAQGKQKSRCCDCPLPAARRMCALVTSH